MIKFAEQDWKDERLTWSDNVSTLHEIVLDGKAIWKPEFAVINGYVRRRQASHVDTKSF